MKHQAICINAAERTVTTASLSFEDAQKFVGGYLEPVRFEADMLLVDEDGMSKGLATRFTLRGHTFLGNAVIFGSKGSDFADCTVTEDAVRAEVRF